MQGRLGGTGKMVILPVDQGFEHGPARSFAPNPAAYDPHYHYQLAIDAGLNAYAAPLGMIEAGRRHLRRPDPDDPQGQLVELAGPRPRDRPGDHRLGRRRAAARLRGDRLHHLSGLGRRARHVRGDLASCREEAKAVGIADGDLVLSARRATSRKDGETAIDVGAYAAHMAALLGAHIIKVKLLDRPSRAGRGEEGLREAQDRLVDPGGRGSATACRRLRRPAHRGLLRRRGQGRGRGLSRTRAPSATAAATARSSAATPSSARATTRWRCSTSSCGSTRARNKLCGAIHVARQRRRRSAERGCDRTECRLRMATIAACARRSTTLRGVIDE